MARIGSENSIWDLGESELSGTGWGGRGGVVGTLILSLLLLFCSFEASQSKIPLVAGEISDEAFCGG